MSDFIFARKSRNIASNAVHALLNLLLGLGSVFITVLSASPLFGLILVIVAKWRIFAVRPRFWWINLKSNLVDLIVGISIVLLSYYSGSSILIVDFLLAAIYCVWLLFIKPLSNETAALTQSLFAVFLGTAAVATMFSSNDSFLLVLFSFLIGYASSRHILVQSDDKDFALTTLVCGLIFAEIAWLCHSWTIIYTFGSTGIRIPQLSIILTIFAFIYNYTRQAILRNRDDLRFKDIAAPVIFGIALISIIVLWFSNPIFNI